MKRLSVLVCFLLIVNMFQPLKATAGEENWTASYAGNVSKAENFSVPEVVQWEENGTFVGRDYEAEKDLNTIVLKNEDGTNTMYLFDYPVKYVDEKGTWEEVELFNDEISTNKTFYRLFGHDGGLKSG